MIQFDYVILFMIGWFNHQLETDLKKGLQNPSFRTARPSDVPRRRPWRYVEAEKTKGKHGSWTEREDGTTMGHNRWRKNTQIPNKKWWALFVNHNMYSNCKSGLFRKSSQSQSWYHLEVVLGVLQNQATNPKPVWIVEDQCEATNYYHLDPKYCKFVTAQKRRIWIHFVCCMEQHI